MDLHNFQFVSDFLGQNRLMVISSINAKGASESAVVGFSQTKTGEIIFATTTTTRKYKNISQNPDISAVIGWDDGKTLQIEGRAIECKGRGVDGSGDTYSQVTYVNQICRCSDRAVF